MHLKRGRVCQNWPTKVGRRGSSEKTGACVAHTLSIVCARSVANHSQQCCSPVQHRAARTSMESPRGPQKPLLDHGVNGQGIPRSRTSAKMLWYSYQNPLIPASRERPSFVLNPVASPPGSGAASSNVTAYPSSARCLAAPKPVALRVSFSV